MKRLSISTILVAAAWTLAAAEKNTNNPATPPPHGNRFLFVVETSTATARLDHGGRQAVVDMIYTGLDGQMREGDTFAVWNFNEQVFAGIYPMQVWKPDDTELASSAGLFLKSCPYDKKGRYELAIKEVAGLVRAIQNVNIFVLSDPASRPPTDYLGSGFSNTFATEARKARSKKQPVITAIVACNGSISNVIVKVGGDPIKLPAYATPPHPKPAPAPVAKAPVVRMRKDPIIITNSKPKLGEVVSNGGQISYVSSRQTNAIPVPSANAVAEAVTTNPAAVAAQPPVSEGTNSGRRVMVIKTVEPKTNGAPAAAQVAPSSAKPEASTNAVSASTPPPATTAAAKEPPVVIVQPTAPVATFTSARTEAAPKASAPFVPTTKVAARELTKASDETEAKAEAKPTIAMVPVVTAQDRTFSPLAMIVIGTLMLLLALTLALLTMHFFRRPADASFITQSMDRSA
jgi:hypothetical protein